MPAKKIFIRNIFLTLNQYLCREFKYGINILKSINQNGRRPEL